MGTALLEGTQGNKFNCYHLGDSMNERIQKLAEQATSIQGPTPYNPLTFEVFDKEKFAKLIVQECLAQVDKVDEVCEDDAEKLGISWVGYAIAKHFGVEG
jgi:hypothetical protein